MTTESGHPALEEPEVGPMVAFCDGAGGLLYYERPVTTVEAREVHDVISALQEVERRVESEGLHAAGFVCYEAAPAFDEALSVRPDGAVSSIPLLWFGLFKERRKASTPPPPSKSLLGDIRWRPSISETEFLRRIDQIKNYILSGDTYQVNFTYRLGADFDGNPWSAFLHLAAAQQAGYGGYIDAGEWAICSASPESFFELNGERLLSRPMKGTARRAPSAREDRRRAEELRASEKDRAENAMIVDMVRNDLGRVARTGSVRVIDPFAVERYPTVWQMVSTVEGRTIACVTDIFRALFPAASITGAPKKRTMEIIAELETTPRGIYTGAMGVLSPGRQARFNVAIRTLAIDRRRREAVYGVGGGIVWDSQGPLEYEECRTKALILSRPPVGDFHLLETMLFDPAEGVFLLDKHIERLMSSAEYFDFSVDMDSVNRRIDEAIEDLTDGRHKIRLLIDRKGKVEIEVSPLDSSGTETLAPLRLTLAAEPVDSSDPFLYHKTTRRQVYEEAARVRPGFDDVILFNEKGEVTETTIANLAIKRNGHWLTPPIHCGLLAGTMRAHLLESGALREAIIPVADLSETSRVKIFNSVRGEREARFIPPPGF